VDFDDFLDDVADYYMAHHHEELSEEQVQWLEIIYEEYAQDDGSIDWDDHSHDSAWYYYLTEVLGIDESDVDRYTSD
jgi:hypothetical protein